MTDETGAVYDLGYEPYTGERSGRSGARRTLFWDGVRRVLGFRRKARRKIAPWTLLIIAVVPSIVAVGASFLIPSVNPDSLNLAAQNATFFGIAGTITMLFTAMAAPELLIPDRKDGVLSMLASRPLTTVDYLGSRFASLVTIVAGFMILPQLLLYVGQAATDTDGLLQGFINAADTLPKIAFVAVVYTVAFVPMGFFVASLSTRKSIATASYLAVMIALTGMAEALVRNSGVSIAKWAALFAPINTADAANLWVFGEDHDESLLAAADIHPLVGIAALLVMGIALTYFSLRRYRKLL